MEENTQDHKGDAKVDGSPGGASSPVQRTKEKGNHPDETEATSTDAQVAMEEEETEEDEWEYAFQLQAELDDGMRDAPSCSPPKLTTERRTFQVAKKFDEM